MCGKGGRLESLPQWVGDTRRRLTQGETGEELAQTCTRPPTSSLSCEHNPPALHLLTPRDGGLPCRAFGMAWTGLDHLLLRLSTSLSQIYFLFKLPEKKFEEVS